MITASLIYLLGFLFTWGYEFAWQRRHATPTLRPPGYAGDLLFSLAASAVWPLWLPLAICLTGAREDHPFVHGWKWF